jgi:hypothetical protein
MLKFKVGDIVEYTKTNDISGTTEVIECVVVESSKEHRYWYELKELINGEVRKESFIHSAYEFEVSKCKKDRREKVIKDLLDES